MPHALVIRHMYSGSLFTIEESFRENGIEFTYAEGFATDISKIDALKPDIVVVLGGAMGVYEGRLFPWLADEIELSWFRVLASCAAMRILVTVGIRIPASTTMMSSERRT